jgi:hypothetical protein
VFGLSLLCYAIFSYKDEEQRLANWIADAFEELKKRENTVSERIRLTLRALILGHCRIFDRTYRDFLLSKRAALVSFDLCVGFCTVWVVVVSSWHPLWGWFCWKYTPIA